MERDGSAGRRGAIDTRQLLLELSAENPAWGKVAVAPELFGLGPQALELVAYLRTQGLRVGSPRPTEDSKSVAPVTGEGGAEGLRLELDPSLPRLIRELGAWPDDSAARTVLALGRCRGFDREVDARQGELAVSVAVAFDPVSGQDILKRLEGAATEVAAALNARHEVPRTGYQDFVWTLAGTGVPVPYVPRELRAQLRRSSHREWTTGIRVDSSMHGGDVDEPMRGPVSDQMTFNHGSAWSPHAVRWRLVHGPLAMIVEGFLEHDRLRPDSAASLAYLFAQASILAEAAEERVRGESMPDQEWLRPVYVRATVDQATLALWNPLRGERTEVAGEPVWQEAARAIERCAIPHVGEPST